ncbi:hypothetical protein GCM10010465_06390 [Actinomadura fibrosa]
MIPVQIFTAEGTGFLRNLLIRMKIIKPIYIPSVEKPSILPDSKPESFKTFITAIINKRVKMRREKIQNLSVFK